MLPCTLASGMKNKKSSFIERCGEKLKGMVRPENFYPPLERAQKNMQEHVFGSFLSRLEVGPI